MDKLLRRLKLKKDFSTRLPLSKLEFMHRLSKIVDQDDTGFLYNIFEIFDDNKKVYKGKVNYNDFEIRRLKKFLDSKAAFAVAKGKYFEEDGKLIVQTEVSASKIIFIFFISILVLFYSVFVFGFLNQQGPDLLFMIPFLIFHASLVGGIPYFLMRRGINNMVYDLEREYYYLTKED